jgi:hypothetical protein
MRNETKKPVVQALLMKSGGTNNLKQNTMIKKMKKAGTAKKKGCPPDCGETLKEKFKTKGSRIGLGALAGMAATQGGIGLVKRIKGVNEEKDKLKKEGKSATRKEARASYLNKLKAGPASSPETQKRGGTTKGRARKK